MSVMFLTVCAILPFAAQAQDSQTAQNQSVAEVARRSREQNKYAAKRPRVITNDDLDRENSKSGQNSLNVAAPGAPHKGATGPSAVAAEAAARTVTSAEKESGLKYKESEELAAKDAEIVSLKQQLANVEQIIKLKDQLSEAQIQLTWQQRELMLDQHTIYSNPNYTDYRTGQARLDAEQQRINERQQEIGALKGHLAELEWRQSRREQAASPESIPEVQ